VAEQKNISPHHQPDRQRFIVEAGEDEAVLEYRLLPGNGIDFTYTFVPQALRGQGIAEKLVRTGLGWAREQGYEIQAGCWYVARFLKRGSKTR
jgi:predicted GNAT family acetyltransferase